MKVQNDVNRRSSLATVAAAGRDVVQATASLLTHPPVLAGVAAAAGGSAHAAAFTLDVTDVVSTISGGVTALSAIGVAVLSLVVVIKLFKWAQRTL